MLKAIALVLLLAGCATVPDAAPKNMEVQCANPSSFQKFTYRGFDSFEMEGNSLVVFSETQTVVYPIPAGSACRIREINEEIEFE